MWTGRWTRTLFPYPFLPPSLINLTVSVDVKHHEKKKNTSWCVTKMACTARCLEGRELWVAASVCAVSTAPRQNLLTGFAKVSQGSRAPFTVSRPQSMAATWWEACLLARQGQHTLIVQSSVPSRRQLKKLVPLWLVYQLLSLQQPFWKHLMPRLAWWCVSQRASHSKTWCGKYRLVRQDKTRLTGPNCLGIIKPGEYSIGITPSYMQQQGGKKVLSSDPERWQMKLCTRQHKLVWVSPCMSGLVATLSVAQTSLTVWRCSCPTQILTVLCWLVKLEDRQKRKQHFI